MWARPTSTRDLDTGGAQHDGTSVATATAAAACSRPEQSRQTSAAEGGGRRNGEDGDAANEAGGANKMDERPDMKAGSKHHMPADGGGTSKKHKFKEKKGRSGAPQAARVVRRAVAQQRSDADVTR